MSQNLVNKKAGKHKIFINKTQKRWKWNFIFKSTFCSTWSTLYLVSTSFFQRYVSFTGYLFIILINHLIVKATLEPLKSGLTPSFDFNYEPR